MGKPLSTFEPPEPGGGLERRDFHLAAAAQRVCQRCGRPRDFAGGHHVVLQQELKRIGRQDVLWDPRNALRLCIQCHANNHGLHHIKLTDLTAANYEFAFEVLGARAADYLRAKYDGDDPRLEAWIVRTGSLRG